MFDIFQVLKRHTQKVYATPSRRKMDGKGDGEEITYPHICFSVDNFEDGFEDVIVRDGESVGIELTASAPRHSTYIRTVISKVSVQPKPRFWFRSDTETGPLFRFPIPKPGFSRTLLRAYCSNIYTVPGC